jgi:hypothetical protein
MKNKLFNKKGDALSSIIVAIVFIIIALIMIPAFRGMQVDNTSATKAISNSHITFVNEGLTDAGSGADYQLDTDLWDTTDATTVQ